MQANLLYDRLFNYAFSRCGRREQSNFNPLSLTYKQLPAEVKQLRFEDKHGSVKFLNKTEGLYLTKNYLRLCAKHGKTIKDAMAKLNEGARDSFVDSLQPFYKEKLTENTALNFLILDTED